MIDVEELAATFRVALALALSGAQSELAEPLPSQLVYRVETAGGGIGTSSVTSAVASLMSGGKVSPIVDVAILGVIEDRTIVWLRPSGYPGVDAIAETWNELPGCGPFKPIGLLLPASVRRDRAVPLQDLRDAVPEWVKRGMKLD